MRASPRSSRSPLRLTASVTATLVLAALVVPMAALADDTASDDRATHVPPPEVVVDEVHEGELPAIDETGPAPADPLVAACDDLLTVIGWNAPIAPDDDHAVFISAQQLEADRQGWASATWEVTPGTSLTAVFATDIDGEVSELDAAPTGTATDVAELTFCGTAGPSPAPASTTTCDDLIAVATPDATTGDQDAVVLSARAFDRDVPGWSNIGWEPADGTTLRAVIVTGNDGGITTLTDGTDSATDVAELTFCGTVVPVAAPTEVAPAETARTEVTPSEPAPATSPGATSTSPPSPAPAPARAPAPTDDEPTEPETEPEEPAGVVVVEPLEAPDDADGSDAEAEAEEAEVLGVQFTRDEQVAARGPLGTWVGLLAVLALLATAGGLIRSRRS